MNDPQKQLRDYLKRLIENYLYIKALDGQLKLLAEWESPKRVEAIELGGYFFQLVTYTFGRTILIELYKLLSKREDKSLLDWLKKAFEHAGAINPTLYNPETGLRESVPVQEYRKIIKQHEAEIDAHSVTIQRIKSRRDKALAHAESAYFNDPKKAYKKYPLSCSDIDTLMDTVSEILRWHHVYLLQSDMRMEVVSATNVDVVLQYARGFQRARKNRALIEKGFKPFRYMHDDYDERDNM